jgi:hypothetical protein
MTHTDMTNSKRDGTSTAESPRDGVALDSHLVST